MKEFIKAGLVAAAVFAVVGASEVKAGGSLAFVEHQEPPSGCYLRGDVGIAFDAHSNADFRGQVDDEEFDNGYMLEGGYGCALTSRLRAEIMAGYHSERDFEGIGSNGPDYTAVMSYTLMANFYLDIGHYRRFRPYIGAGLGFAYNVMDDWYGLGNLQRVAGDEDLAFAWALMAGFGYQLTPRTTLDIGYRYLNVGGVSSERRDSTNAVNPFFNINDIGTHEIKAGFRYQLHSSPYVVEGPLK